MPWSASTCSTSASLTANPPLRSARSGCAHCVAHYALMRSLVQLLSNYAYNDADGLRGPRAERAAQVLRGLSDRRAADQRAGRNGHGHLPVPRHQPRGYGERRHAARRLRCNTRHLFACCSNVCLLMLMNAPATGNRARNFLLYRDAQSDGLPELHDLSRTNCGARVRLSRNVPDGRVLLENWQSVARAHPSICER